MKRIATVSPDTPFRERLLASFGYPLRGAALATCAALSLAHYLVLLPALIGVMVKFALWTATWRYAATCMLHTANGFADPPDLGVEENPSAGRGLTYIHLLAVALCVLSALFYPPMVWPLILLFALMLPAIDMSLAFDGNLEQAMSPVMWWEVISRFGSAYLIPVAINLATGALIVVASIATNVLPTLLSLPLFAFAYTYLIILNLHLMGAMIHQYHERFGITPESEMLVQQNGQDDDEQLLQAARALSTTDRRAALAMLATRLQDRQAPPSIHQAYRQLLRDEGLKDALLVHGQVWIAALIAANEPRRALGLVQECMDIDSAFVPDDPVNASIMAEQAAHAGMTRMAVKLCRGFLMHWPRSPECPRMGLLAARLLVDPLGQRAEAAVLLGKLMAAWPEHRLHGDMDALARQLREASSA